jgi:hypothetical protein
MTSYPVPTVAAAGTYPEALSRGRVVLLLSLTTLLALMAYYVIGVEQGVTSAFGDNSAIHEWVHDARHFLGFPCH